MGAIESIVVICTSVVGLLIALAKLERHQRSRVWDWSKRLAALIVYAGVVINSIIGFFLFLLSKQPITRWEVVVLFGHYFNLIAYCTFFLVDLRKWIDVCKVKDDGVKVSSEA